MTNTASSFAVTNELKDDEKLIWHGQPAPGAWASAWIGVGIFGIIFFLFSIYFLQAAMKSPDTMTAWYGYPFIGIGVVLVLTPLWQFIVGKNTAYALTDKRAIVVRTFPGLSVRSFSGSDMDEIESKGVSDNGYGTVTFARRKSGGRKSDFRPDWGFYGIDDVKDVEAQLLKLKDAA
ncbi:MAG: hypothetical protein OQK24_04775 [Magnetovibrio sp.]|nr:hypothetical protein [Magnetovibrio sp.]